jgi:hypothetical protein
MLSRLLLGMFIGLALGALVAAGVVQGLHWVTFGAAFFAYALAAGTGMVVGLVAGKPVWAKGGQIEAALKAVFGALLAAGGMYALRTWVHFDVSLEQLRAGAGPIGELPAASLPLIAAVLGAFFGLDNTPSPEEGKRARVAGNVRVASGGEALDDAADEAPAAAKKRSR